MHPEGVFIKVEHSEFGCAKGSGLKINNIIIAHGSILASLCFTDKENSMLNRYNKLLKELHFAEHNENLSNDVIKFKVLHRNFNESEQLVNFKSCSDKEFITEKATYFILHHYTGMLNISQELANWTNNNNSCDENVVDQLINLLLPKFIFLTIGKPSKNLFKKSLYTLLARIQNSLLYSGLPLIVESTPFSNFSLFNSWSRGIVSKIIGRMNDGIITDARLVTGCEGGPIFTFDKGGKGQLIGIVVQTIAWCSGEWVGFSLGLSIKHLLKEVLGLHNTIDYIPFDKLLLNLPASTINIDKLAASIVFVRCRQKWGSGVVISANEGLILTCSHIINHDYNAVSVLCDGDRFLATVVYASSVAASYDVALLSVGKVPKLRELKMAESPPILGETVVAAGYPLTTESLVTHNRTPTLSMGCVAKISDHGGPLQTTCCTHSGLSGGAILRPPDQLLGIIVSNIRLDSTTMPSFSFAMSVGDLKGPISKYIATKDLSYLQQLCQESGTLKMEWSLIDSKL